MKIIEYIIAFIVSLIELISNRLINRSANAGFIIEKQKLLLKKKIQTHNLIAKYQNSVSNIFKERELHHMEDFAEYQINQVNELIRKGKLNVEIAEILIKRLKRRAKKIDYNFVFSVDERLRFKVENYNTLFINFLNLKKHKL